ncbi:hypothetical protein EI534_22720 [Pseudomonas frederiksbergensis]|nr:hypothetical protein [Pseudomonas frederiksbergensis]
MARGLAPVGSRSGPEYFATASQSNGGKPPRHRCKRQPASYLRAFAPRRLALSLIHHNCPWAAKYDLERTHRTTSFHPRAF